MAWRYGLAGWVVLPHFDGRSERAPIYAQSVANGVLPDGYAVDDGAAVHFVDGMFARGGRRA